MVAVDLDAAFAIKRTSTNRLTLFPDGRALRSYVSGSRALSLDASANLSSVSVIEGSSGTISEFQVATERDGRTILVIVDHRQGNWYGVTYNVEGISYTPVLTLLWDARPDRMLSGTLSALVDNQTDDRFDGVSLVLATSDSSFSSETYDAGAEGFEPHTTSEIFLERLQPRKTPASIYVDLLDSDRVLYGVDLSWFGFPEALVHLYDAALNRHTARLGEDRILLLGEAPVSVTSEIESIQALNGVVTAKFEVATSSTSGDFQAVYVFRYPVADALAVTSPPATRKGKVLEWKIPAQGADNTFRLEITTYR